MATFDVTSRVLRKIAVPTADMQSVMGARWHPALDRILYIEVVAQAPGPQVAVWMRYANGRNASKVHDASFISRVDWSADGSRIYAAIGGDDSVFYISDVLTHQGGAKACRRGDVNAPVCL